MTGADFGRATQARFLMDAHSRGLLVSLPFDSFPGYDAIVDAGRKVYRVQIKGSHPSGKSAHGAYRINVSRHARRSHRKFDVLAVWLDNDQRWMLIPSRRCRVKQIWIHKTGSKFTRYSGNWGIFR